MADSYHDRPAGRAPVSAHPAFPAIVALWFAALLGLGTLVLPVALLEKLVAVTGFAHFVPSAAPPLGFTARTATALCASIAGAVVGLLLARRLAKAPNLGPRQRRLSAAEEWQCQPISAHDELGDEGLESPALASPSQVNKRRFLATGENVSRSDFFQAAPVPGQSTDDQLAEIAFAETPAEQSTDDPFRQHEAGHEPLELDTFGASAVHSEAEGPELDAEDGLQALRRRVQVPELAARQHSPTADENFRYPATFDEDDAETQEFNPVDQPHGTDTSGSEAGSENPMPFAAPSLRRSNTPAIEQEEHVELGHTVDGDKMCESDDIRVAEQSAQLSLVEGEGECDAGERPLADLGLVQLAAHLGALIERRRVRSAERACSARATPPAGAPFGPEDFGAAAAEDAAFAIANFFEPPSASETQADGNGAHAAPDHQVERAATEAAPTPGSQQDVSIDADGEDQEDAFTASFSLPVAKAIAGTDTVTRDGEEYDEEEQDEGHYSSLLEMKNPFARQQEIVRIDEPEDGIDSIDLADTFPAPAARSRPHGGAPKANASLTGPHDPPEESAQSPIASAASARPSDSRDADRNLREALATLQRMSGAS